MIHVVGWEEFNPVLMHVLLRAVSFDDNIP